jgi:epoxyqueuosine reductase
MDTQQLAKKIKTWGQELGFQQVAVTNTDLADYLPQYKAFLEKNYHGEMSYLEKNVDKISDPEKLFPGVKSIIMVRMNYLPAPPLFEYLKNPVKAFISRYALGKDYHRLMRKRLQKLADKINHAIGEFNYRAFTDSAPVLEKPLAEKAGLGWIGKHTNLINKEAGSWFFIGELFTDLPLPFDTPDEDHCGSCDACITACPTQAIVAPYQLDARRCISYLTIEFHGSIPLDLRPLIGNRIYGCDDCQLACPWNKFATATEEEGFYARRHLESAELLEIFDWDEQTFLEKTQGSAIRRINHQLWLRNVAVALGNVPYDEKIIIALETKLLFPSDLISALVREHIQWAIERQKNSKEKPVEFNPSLKNIPEKRWVYYR